MNTFKVPLFVALLHNVVLAVKFPDEIEFCHKSAPDWNRCIGTQISNALKELKDGAPELGIPKLEPFEIPKLEIFGDKISGISLDQKYSNMLTYGFYISEVYDANFKVNEKECYWDFKVLTPYTRIEANYELIGQVFVFPLNSHGKCNFTITNLRNHHQVWCELYKKKGKTYLKQTKYQIDMEGEKIQFEFENIMPGNEQVSTEIGKALNENSQDIFREIKHAFEAVWSKLHMQTSNNVLAKIPADEIFPE